MTTADGIEIHVVVNKNASNGTQCWTGGQKNPCGDINLALRGVNQLSLSQVATLVIHAGTYQLTSSNYNHFPTTKNLTFEAFANDKVTINCTVGAGLSFSNVANITFRDVSFVNCGALHNSTSRDLANRTDHQFVPMYAALYFMNCTDVTLDGISISRSLGVAVQFYATVGTNTITNSSFTENPFPTDAPQGGGLYIEFPYCYPGLSETCGQVVPASVSNSFYIIESNVFINNYARVSDTEANSSTFYTPNKQQFYVFGRGGGISLVFKGKNINNQFMVQQNQCYGNSALLGGCIYIDCQDNSTSNNVTIKDFWMVNNTALEGGGAIDQRFTTFINPVTNNSIRFSNCEFRNNSAHWGGGLSMFSGREYDAKHQSNKVFVTRCKFFSNVGTYGSAVALEVWKTAVDGVPITAAFEDECIFEENFNKNPLADGSEVFGALFMKNMPALFNGNITFLRNKGSAIVAISSSIIVADNSTVNFYENRAAQGAAISLLADAYVVMNQGTTYNFVRNSASQRGGAIYAEIEGERDPTSRNCFFAYGDGYSANDKPETWDVYVRFINNTVGNAYADEDAACRYKSQTNKLLYNAIFATSILPCLFGAAISADRYVSLEERQKVFCWSQDHWIYTCPCPNHEIQTEPYRLVPDEDLFVTPGVNTQFNLTAYDDLEQNVTSSLVLRAESDTFNVSMGTNSEYTSSNTLQLDVASQIDAAKIALVTLPPRIISTTLNVTITQCPMGLELLNGKCYNTGDFGGYLQTSKDDQFAKIFRGYWVGSYPQYDNKTVAGYCIFCKRFYAEQYRVKNSTSGAYVPLDFTPDEDLICAAANRTGPFCTECKPNHSMAVFSRELVCIESSQSNVADWVGFIIGNVLFIIAISIFLLIIKLPCVAGPLAGALFFVQMVTTAVVVDANGIITYPINGRWYNTLTCVYGFFNLDFCHSAFDFLTVDLPLPTFHLIIEAKSLVLIVVVVAIGIIIEASSRVFKKRQAVEQRSLLQKDTCNNFVIGVKKHYVNMAASFLLLRYTIIAITALSVLDKVPIYSASGHTGHEIQVLDSSHFAYQNLYSQFLHPLFVLLLAVIPILFLITCCRFVDKKANDDLEQRLECNFCCILKYAVTSLLSVIEPFQSLFKDEATVVNNNSINRESSDSEDTDSGAGSATVDDEPLPKLYKGIANICWPWYDNIIDNFFNCLTTKCCCRCCTCLMPLTVKRGKYRFVGGLYLLLRIVILIIFAYGPDFMFVCIAQTVVSVFAGMFVLVFRPYKVNMYNNIDGFFFFTLGLLICLCAYQFHLTQSNSDLSIWAFITQIILLTLPIVWIFFYIFLEIILKIFCCCKKKTNVAVA